MSLILQSCFFDQMGFQYPANGCIVLYDLPAKYSLHVHVHVHVYPTGLFISTIRYLSFLLLKFRRHSTAYPLYCFCNIPRLQTTESILGTNQLQLVYLFSENGQVLLICAILLNDELMSTINSRKNNFFLQC